MAAKIKKGDRVVVIHGRDVGKRGEVVQVFPERQRVIVRGVATARRHTRPSQGSPGGIVEKDLSIHVSNVACIDPKDGRRVRVGFKILENGSKIRVSRRSGEPL